MISCVGTEDVKLTAPLKLLNKVETYLKDMINSMVNSLRDYAKKSFGCYDPKTYALQIDRKEWINGDPA